MDAQYFKESGATFSDCEKYRYRLWRQWDDGPRVAFLMLNPSTADADRNDPTVERCHRRAVAMGFGAMEVINIFAFRATDPRDLKQAAQPVGPLNDATILESARASDTLICAWGSHGDFQNRDEQVRTLLRTNGIKAQVLKLTSKGQPGHPLYIPYSCTPVPWEDI
ncbi:DUF1643 domain-containing protein [Sneathiella chinensis]|uniref:DUF1643 domain-containing protein n=1 Tax=Sneathiella chinensis TaxID=349750 RepID=A0ABQ5U2F1_9PROT|nr:DUF1643 domain-containing protein [Sneathiella chinensis]GLQ05517.1 hypothetical protein GCM10007924_07380 [Sneathiella chinensis]